MAGQQSNYDLLPIYKAQQIVLEHTESQPIEHVGLMDSLGRVVAADIQAQNPLPPFPASVKDGYAVVSKNCPGEFDLVADVRPGQIGEVEITENVAAYITTGAPVPSGADAVVQVEDSELLELPERKRVKLSKSATAGQDIRPIGFDMQAGDTVIPKGSLIHPPELGLLATVGSTQIPVYRKAKVAVMSSGDEIIEPSANPQPGQIRDSNRPLLKGCCLDSGVCTTDLGIAEDTQESLRSKIDGAIKEEVDVIMSSGGVSMGDRDYVKSVLEEKGKVHFGRVLMKPGKPLTFATLQASHGTVLYFGLPGNPVSCFVCFHLVVAPALAKLQGGGGTDDSKYLPRRVQAYTANDLRLDPQRPEYHRVRLQWSSKHGQGGGFLAISTGHQISSRLLSARAADGLLELPAAAGTLPAGSLVSVLLTGDLRVMNIGEDVGTTDSKQILTQ